jgi:flagellar biosynthetic protein FliR
MLSLDQFISGYVFTFIVVFVRAGTTLMIMPGIGDSFAPNKIRLHIALGLSLVLSPFITQYMPAHIPQTGALLVLLTGEFIIGMTIGTVARILMTALDTAGMLISMQSGLGSAQLFNPASATQGSVIGAVLSMTGMVFLFATNMHHMLIMAVVESYNLFPVGQMPNMGDLADLIVKTVALAFYVGLRVSAPFMIVGLMMYVTMGIIAEAGYERRR